MKSDLDQLEKRILRRVQEGPVGMDPASEGFDRGRRRLRAQAGCPSDEEIAVAATPSVPLYSKFRVCCHVLRCVSCRVEVVDLTKATMPEEPALPLWLRIAGVYQIVSYWARLPINGLRLAAARWFFRQQTRVEPEPIPVITSVPAFAELSKSSGVLPMSLGDWLAALSAGADGRLARLLSRAGSPHVELRAAGVEAVDRVVALGTLPALFVRPGGSTDDGQVDQFAAPRLSPDGAMGLVVRIPRNLCSSETSVDLALVASPAGKAVGEPVKVPVGKPASVKFNLPEDLRGTWSALADMSLDEMPLRFIVFAGGSLKEQPPVGPATGARVTLSAEEQALVAELVTDGLAIQEKFRPEPLYRQTGKGHYDSQTVEEIRHAREAGTEGREP